MIKGHQIYAGMPPRLRKGWKRGFAACLGVAALSLMGCTGDTSSAQTPSQTDATDQTVAQSQTDSLKTDSPAHVSEPSRNGKPTKTIDTPTGPKVIVDQGKRTDVLSAIKVFKSYKVETPKQTPSPEVLAARQLLFDSVEIQKFDVLRLGCVSYVDYSCTFNNFYFREACKDTKFNTSEWSACEKDVLEVIARPTISSSACIINEKRHRVGYWQDPILYWNQNVENLAEEFFLNECKVWRGDEGWESKLHLNQLNYLE